MTRCEGALVSCAAREMLGASPSSSGRAPGRTRCKGPRGRLRGRGELLAVGSSILDGFVQESLDVLKSCPGDNAVSSGNAHPAPGAVKGVDQEPHLSPYACRVLFLQDVLDVDADQEGQAVTSLSRDRNFVHRAFLDRVEDVEADFNQVLQDVRVVAARVEPPVDLVLLQRLPDARI